MSYTYLTYFILFAQELFMTQEKVIAVRGAVTAAVDKIGGLAETARKLKARLIENGREDEAAKMAIGKIWSWVHRDQSGIPIQFLIDMEVLSGISRKKLRPDIPWESKDTSSL